ncbi:MAG TPA: hypothetical protein GXZ86_00555 [Clostridiales bacterium]|jgi:hypothetical protein|nr:hypothetical protein [Clostridiales bacterium]
MMAKKIEFPTKPISKEEYYNLVVKCALTREYYLTEMSDDKMMKYLESQKDYINGMWEDDTEAVALGEVNSYAGGISGTLYGLDMMCEDFS